MSSASSSFAVVAIARHNERFWFHQAISIIVTDDGAFKHGLVLQQAVLDFRRRDKDAADFQHVVSASVIPVITVRVDVKLIAASCTSRRQTSLSIFRARSSNRARLSRL